MRKSQIDYMLETMLFTFPNVSDLNVSVGNQPHSEVAALALLLDRLHGGKQLQLDFKGPVRIMPCARGKNVVDKRTKDEKASEAAEEE